MKCVSYNIQYGVGIDGKFDIERIVAAIRGADVIALQEVTRNSPMNGLRDLVADIRTLLPEYFAVYGPNFEAEVGSHVADGKAVDIRMQFGNMILSKTPIMLSRNILLPRTRSYDRLNLQRGALEAVIDTPAGPIRFYSVHLDHRSPDERRRQVNYLMERVLHYPLDGGAISGISEFGYPEPPVPDAFVLMGDFNMPQGSPEYCAVAGTPGKEPGMTLLARYGVDAALLPSAEEGPRPTCVSMDDPADASRHERIDYCFVQAGLAGRVRSFRVDTEAIGSDHKPIWLELE